MKTTKNRPHFSLITAMNAGRLTHLSNYIQSTHRILKSRWNEPITSFDHSPLSRFHFNTFFIADNLLKINCYMSSMCSPNILYILWILIYIIIVLHFSSFDCKYFTDSVMLNNRHFNSNTNAWRTLHSTEKPFVRNVNTLTIFC